MQSVRRVLSWLVMLVPVAFFGCSNDTSDPGITEQEQHDMDVATIDEYLYNRGISAIKDPIGIRLVIESTGTGGFPPNINQQVKLKYTLGVMGGTSAVDNGTITQAMNKFIRGVQYGLSIVPKGTRFFLYVPSTLGYGKSQVSTIPPNSILIFQLELQDVITTSEDAARLTTDVAAIDKFLVDNNVANVVKDTTGIRYVVVQQGSGYTPNWYDAVRFNYTGKVLTTNVQFNAGSAVRTDVFASRVVDYIHGLKAALQHMQVGTKLIVYIPSGLAFGNDASNVLVPANSNIVYEIELLEIY